MDELNLRVTLDVTVPEDAWELFEAHGVENDPGSHLRPLDTEEGQQRVRQAVINELLSNIESVGCKAWLHKSVVLE